MQKNLLTLRYMTLCNAVSFSLIFAHSSLITNLSHSPSRLHCDCNPSNHFFPSPKISLILYLWMCFFSFTSVVVDIIGDFSCCLFSCSSTAAKTFYPAPSLTNSSSTHTHTILEISLCSFKPIHTYKEWIGFQWDRIFIKF